ncbi:MAG: hypothetical protein GWP59_00945 [Chlamydiales bacterium]|nr:hypothetical protein [Chlamydiales bacterium]NCF70244.1 hypothetical protein [Chlamydiales bacterium]
MSELCLPELTQQLFQALKLQALQQELRIDLSKIPSLKDLPSRSVPPTKKEEKPVAPLVLKPAAKPKPSKQQANKKNILQSNVVKTDLCNTPPPVIEESFHDIEKSIFKHFSTQTWHKSPLDDSEAKQAQLHLSSETKLAPCLIILDKPEELRSVFFQNLAHTLSFYLENTEIISTSQAIHIEKDRIEKEVKLILSSEAFSSQLSSKEKDSPKNACTFKSIPLIILSHSEAYTNQSDKKKHLWNEIKKHLSHIL